MIKDNVESLVADLAKPMIPGAWVVSTQIEKWNLYLSEPSGILSLVATLTTVFWTVFRVRMYMNNTKGNGTSKLD